MSRLQYLDDVRVGRLLYIKYHISDFGIGVPDMGCIRWNKRTKTRYTAQFGIDYYYSGKLEKANDWVLACDLYDIMEVLNDRLGLGLNCCLVNKYLDNEISGIGRHKDGESEHVDDLIVSISFGASVEFELDGEIIELCDGDICIFNRNSWHSIPYQLRSERISLTYRQFVEG